MFAKRPDRIALTMLNEMHILLLLFKKSLSEMNCTFINKCSFQLRFITFLLRPFLIRVDRFKMNGGKKPGFGSFGSAMFAIHDIQSMYDNIDKKSQEPKQLISVKAKPVINEPKKTTNLVKKVNPSHQNQKPKIILKPSTINLSKPTTTQNPVNKTSAQILNKQLIQQVKKNEGNHKLQQLFCLEVAQSTFELNIFKKKSQWGYHIFQEDGKNAKQIVSKPQITFTLHQRNVLQGSIGNCYFICTLAALTKNIEVLKKRIPNSENYNPASHSFKVNLFQSGKLIQINVLNSFKENYSKPIENDITSLILEKAYAQLYGNYEIINMGYSIDSFRDLSGHVAEYIDLKDKKKCQKQIIQAFESSHPMVIASKSKPEVELISGKHSYNLLSYSNKNGNLFIQLRDPRGWTKANFNAPGYLLNQPQNGQFWISYDDLVNNFEVITVSRYMPKSQYYYKTFGAKEIPVNGLRAIMFSVSSEGDIGFSIHQKHKKFFDINHKYNVINLMVCEVYNSYPVKTLKTNFNSQQVCSFTLNLPKGNYVIVGQIYPFRPTKNPYPDEIFTLSMTSTTPLSNFMQILDFNPSQALISYIQSHKNQFKALISAQNLHRHHGSLFGKMCILYQNFSGKSVIQQLQFQTQNIEVKDKKVTLQNNEIKLVTHPIGPANNCSHKCVFKSKTYYKK